VTQCYSTGAISGDTSVGGLVGYNSGTVTQCYSTGTISGENSAGGLVGGNDGTLTGCYSTGAVMGSDGVGGLTGQNDWYVTKCYSTSAVSGNYCVGGLVAWNWGSLTHCYSTGTVSGDTYVGGLVGYNSEPLSQCYSTGSVRGTGQYIGGLLGRNYFVDVRNCFWDIQTSDQPTSDGGTGKTTAEMKQQSTFEGWDFINVWGIGENQTYPYLRKYSAVDINQDASVNFLDLAVLAENWLTDLAP